MRKVWNTSMYVNKRGGGVRKVWNTSMYVNKTGGGGKGVEKTSVEYKYVCEQDGGEKGVQCKHVCE